jgi:hypothetical protein
MGLFGLDANSSSSAFTQANATTQTGNAFGANTGKGAASANASGTTVIGGGVKVAKGGSLVISNTNTQLENSIAEGLTNIQSLLQSGQSSGGDTGSSSSGIGGLFGGSSSKSGSGGKAGQTGSITGSGNITLPQALPELQTNQGYNSNGSNELVDALNAMHTSDVTDHGTSPANDAFFSPSNVPQSQTTFPWGSVVLGAVVITGLIVAVKFIK